MANSLRAWMRRWLGLPADHTSEHVDIRADIDEQKVALARLDAYVRIKARKGLERRRVLTSSHPNRRIGDA